MLDLIIAIFAVGIVTLSLTGIIIVGISANKNSKNVQTFTVFELMVLCFTLSIGIILLVYTGNVLYSNVEQQKLESIESLNHDNNLLNKGE